MTPRLLHLAAKVGSPPAWHMSPGLLTFGKGLTLGRQSTWLAHPAREACVWPSRPEGLCIHEAPLLMVQVGADGPFLPPGQPGSVPELLSNVAPGHSQKPCPCAGQ